MKTIRIRLGHESLDATLACLKDAESEEAQDNYLLAKLEEGSRLAVGQLFLEHFVARESPCRSRGIRQASTRSAVRCEELPRVPRQCLGEEFEVSEEAAQTVLDELRDRRLIEKLYTGTFFISNWRETDDRGLRHR